MMNVYNFFILVVLFISSCQYSPNDYTKKVYISNNFSSALYEYKDSLIFFTPYGNYSSSQKQKVGIAEGIGKAFKYASFLNYKYYKDSVLINVSSHEQFVFLRPNWNKHITWDSLIIQSVYRHNPTIVYFSMNISRKGKVKLLGETRDNCDSSDEIYLKESIIVEELFEEIGRIGSNTFSLIKLNDSDEIAFMKVMKYKGGHIVFTDSGSEIPQFYSSINSFVNYPSLFINCQ